MKLIRLSVFFLLCSLNTMAQHNLQGIVVERYYIADSFDASASTGLAQGAVTYRIYADMMPGCRLQAVYGVPGHAMILATTTSFYNNDSGAVAGNLIPYANLKYGALMLDSWLSVGAASDGCYGVLKTLDNGVKTIQNVNDLLQNIDKEAGIPLKVQDGLIAASPQSAVLFFGLDSLVNIFDKQNTASVFQTDNGSWASLGGAVGYDTTNTVLIAQLTTNGKLSFKLNIQLANPYGGVENYVAESPSGNEIMLPSLTYPSPATVFVKKKRFQRNILN